MNDKEDSLDFTPERMIHELHMEMQTDECRIRARELNLKPTKGLVLLLNDEEMYSTSFRNAGMSVSECIALLEIVKQQMMRLL